MGKSKELPPDYGNLRVTDAGRRGGIRLRELYGHQHFVDLGLKGVDSQRASDPEGFAQRMKDIAHMGGLATHQKHPELAKEIGLKGGLTTKQRRLAEDPDYYSRIGKMSRRKGSTPH